MVALTDRADQWCSPAGTAESGPAPAGSAAGCRPPARCPAAGHRAVGSSTAGHHRGWPGLPPRHPGDPHHPPGRSLHSRRWRTVTVDAVTNLTAAQASPPAWSTGSGATGASRHCTYRRCHLRRGCLSGPHRHRARAMPACATSPSASCAHGATATSPPRCAATPATPPESCRCLASPAHEPTRHVAAALPGISTYLRLKPAIS